MGADLRGRYSPTPQTDGRSGAGLLPLISGGGGIPGLVAFDFPRMEVGNGLQRVAPNDRKRIVLRDFAQFRWTESALPGGICTNYAARCIINTNAARGRLKLFGRKFLMEKLLI